MFGTKERFDLTSLPFSGRDSKIAIFEDEASRNLCLTFSRSPTPTVERKTLIHFSPVIDNKDISAWDYEVTPGKLTIRTIKGIIEFCFAGPKRLRIRGKGQNSLRFYIRNLKTYENGSPREDGSVEVIYEVLGKLLFVPLKGALRQDSMWNHKAARADDFTIDLMPSAESGEFEAVIHEYYSNGIRDAEYPPFDRCAEDEEKAFHAFCSQFASVPREFTELARRAAWTLWTSHVSAEGRMTAPAIFSSKIDLVRAVGWQQAMIATALKGDSEGAYEALMSLFAYQDALGQIPNNISDVGVDYMTAGAPMQGFAIDFLLKHGFDLSGEKLEKLYQAVSGYAGWWLRARSRDGSGVPMYYHPEECGWPDATVFTWGLPVKAPDLTAWLALLTEAAGKLAGKLGKTQEAEKWFAESKRLIALLVTVFWKDGQFVCLNAKSGVEYRVNSVLRLFPVMLGARLPQEIIDALAEDIADEKQFLCAGGVVSEKLRSKEYLLKDTALRGGVLPVVQLVLASGLMDAGKVDLAAEIARRACTLAEEKGAADAIPPFAIDPGTGRPYLAEDDFDVRRGLDTDKDLFKSERKEPKTVIRWTSAGAAGILALANLLGRSGR